MKIFQNLASREDLHQLKVLTLISKRYFLLLRLSWSVLEFYFSSANPKIADYAFTTLKPSLGVVDYLTDKSFVISDIPGLIAGASEGVGLGIQFLKHLSRTRAILTIIDVEDKLAEEIKEETEELIKELKNFDEELVTKVNWIVLNKIDLLSKEDIDFLVETTKDLEKEFSIHTVSAKNRIGTEELVKEVGFYLENLNEEI